MKNRLEHLLNQVVENLVEQNAKLDKLAALLTADQLMNECVDQHGKPRSPEECANIVIESFSAGLCLMGELNQRNRDYQYQKDEFFIDEDEDDEELGPDASARSF